MLLPLHWWRDRFTLRGFRFENLIQPYHRLSVATGSIAATSLASLNLAKPC